MKKHKWKKSDYEFRKTVSKYNKLEHKLKIKKEGDVISKAVNYFIEQNPDVTFNQLYSRKLLKVLTLNYIRHNLTNYDRLVKKIPQDIDILAKFKTKINDKILDLYGPRLSYYKDDNLFYSLINWRT